MKKSYVPETIGKFLTESKSITLKRKYGERPTITAGLNAPLRNQVLSFVAENASVSKIDLKNFILGLREGNTSSAAASMFIKRNAHYFITENKNGMTYFKLSNLGQRLVNQFAATQEINEEDDVEIEDDAMDIEAPETAAEEVDFEEIEDDEEEIEYEDEEGESKEDETDNFEYEEDDDKIVLTYYKNPEAHKAEEEAEGEEDFDHNDEEIEDEVEDDDDADFSKYDFKDKGRPGIYDMDESLNETRAKRMRQIIENLKSKSKNSLNEADEADELTDADLDTIDTSDEEGEKPEGDETPDLDADLGGEGEVEKVEITEFIITVDDVDSAIDELAELGVTAERVPIEKPAEEAPAPEETEEKPAEETSTEGEEKPAEEKTAEATKESLQRFVDDLLNEAEEPSDELGLGDQGQDAAELDKPAEAETDLIEPTQEFEQNKIKVQAADWDTLKGWLEEKGVDVKEMFGGDIEVEEFDTEDEANAAVKGEEISDDEIDFSGIGEDDDTKVEDEKTNESLREGIFSRKRFVNYDEEDPLKDVHDNAKKLSNLVKKLTGWTIHPSGLGRTKRGSQSISLSNDEGSEYEFEISSSGEVLYKGFYTLPLEKPFRIGNIDNEDELLDGLKIIFTTDAKGYDEPIRESLKGFDKLTYKVVKPLGDDPAMIGGYLIDDFDNEFNPEVGDTFTAERWQGTFEVKYNGNEYYINMEDFSDTVDAGYFEEI